MNSGRTVIWILAFVITLSASVKAEETTKREEEIKQDRLLIVSQKICPITGNQLGSHGKPVKVSIGKEEVFLCCRGCLKGKVAPKHWATIHANFAKTQAKCPVMGLPLPKKPKWIIVKGKIVFVCCPPCTKKVAADPATYLRKVNQLYTASIRIEQKTRLR